MTMIVEPQLTPTLDADGGAILISGLIGGNYAVGTIDINQDDATHEGNITLHGIGSTAADGVGSGAANIGNAATNLLDLTGAFHTGGDTVYEAKTGGTYIDFLMPVQQSHQQL